MHFYDASINFMGGWGIVGAHVPLAAGMGFASRYRNDKSVAICFLGDGAINQGAFHEGLALSALWGLPCVYVIENNHYAMGTPLHKTAATEDLSIRALAYPMARDTVDGHDIFAVRSCVHAAVQRAREQNLPTLIEAKTYRYRGHSMADPGTYRTKEEVDERKQLDPIKLLGDKLGTMGLSKKIEAIINEIEEEIQDAVKFAEESPYPAPETATDYVYV